MKIKEITSFLESLAPLSSQESYDNCGLIVGDQNAELTKALICLDSTEAVVEEAIATGCNLIIAHHPIVFKGLKKLTGKNYVERVVLKCIKNDIALYAIHTNLDNYRFGVNHEIGRRLGLDNLKVLAPKHGNLNKIAVYVPIPQVNEVASAMYQAGAGAIGDYKECSFQTEGKGTFTPVLNANPAIGELNKAEEVAETKLEVLVDDHRLYGVIAAMKNAHPYEEVAYDIVGLKNENQFEGAGMVGELKQSISTTDFLQLVKDTFNCGVIRHTAMLKDEVKRIAFCGGSGSFLLQDAIRTKADVYITGDFKYHEFFDAEDNIMIADIGHFESEQFTIELLKSLVLKKFPNVTLQLTTVNTNPISYF